MLPGIELAMAMIGIVALVRGRLALSERSVVRGARARMLGVVATLPGIMTVAAFLYVRSLAKPVELPWMWMAQMAAIAGSALVIYLVGLRWADAAERPMSD